MTRLPKAALALLLLLVLAPVQGVLAQGAAPPASPGASADVLSGPAPADASVLSPVLPAPGAVQAPVQQTPVPPAPERRPAPAPAPEAAPAPAAPEPAPTPAPAPAPAPATPAPAPAEAGVVGTTPPPGAVAPPVAAPAPAPSPAPAPAATAPAQPPAAAPQPAAPPAAPAPAPAELGALLELLRDPARRDALIRALEGGEPARPANGAAPAPTPAPGTAPPAEALTDLPSPAEVLAGLRDRATELAARAFDAAADITDVNSLRAWARSVWDDELLRAQVLSAAWQMLLVLAAGMLAEQLVNLLLRRPQRWLDHKAATVEGPLRGIRLTPYVVGNLALSLLPIMAFGIVALGVVGGQSMWPSSRLIMEALVLAYMATRTVMAAARLALAPKSNRLRLVPCSDETAISATRWTRRLAVTTIIFYAAAEGGLLLGLPITARDAIWRVGLLVLSVMAAMVILQFRTVVAAKLAAPPLAAGDVPDRARIAMRALRDRVAGLWHVIVILWMLAAWAVWALQIERGFERLGTASLLTLVILAVAKAADELARRVLIRAFKVSPALTEHYPNLEHRVGAYQPAVKTAISSFILVVSIVALLEVWGLGALAWFDTGRFGSRAMVAVMTVAITLFICVAVWEAANAAIARQLDSLPADGSAARNARVRTLLPMLRTVLGGVLLLVVGLTALSELGVNVAPLLAGAGVLGVAIGFGSQTLVRDVITGIFLLLEDAVAVGDVVSVGGLSGAVEKLTIRSIKLRALDGSVHIVPFSAVTTVTNMTRDFSFALVDLTLDYSADTDEAVMMLRVIAEEMRDDEAWAPSLLAPLEVLGVDRISGEGILVRARMMTPPIRRWAVMRELNRRVKQAAAERGIKLYDPRRGMIMEGKATEAKAPEKAEE
ncbi:mechanosensitive ion channel family protein [Roseococcus thiosulfatophilus]|uniref:mechanosensitive ion channel family protein n=1 Tax=Roseococcus thiosulfatophilus TaxID=35813 RepID=UPI001A8EE359|nr:mechanosensitive ion channel domain-containing protein [Roseococcus thiosulfatophilus]